MQLKLHEPTMAIGYSLRICARHVDSTNPGRSNLVFRSKPIPEAEVSNRRIQRRQSGLKSGGSWIWAKKIRFFNQFSPKFRFSREKFRFEELDVCWI